MQSAVLEWVYRMYPEPRCLSGRYLATNPHALFLPLTLTGLTNMPDFEVDDRRVN